MSANSMNEWTFLGQVHYVHIYSTRQKYATTFLRSCVFMAKNKMVFMRMKRYWTKVQDHPITSEHSNTTSWCIQAVISVPVAVTWSGCLLRISPKIDLASLNFLWF